MAAMRQTVPETQPARSTRGFSLVELMLTIVGLTIVTTMAMSAYGKYMDEARYGQAGTDIRMIEAAITKFYVSQSRYPDDLTEVYPGGVPKDPWGLAYQYWLIEQPAINDPKCRRDRNMKPLNSDYDLYSMGKDKATKYPVQKAPGKDDMIRVRNGAAVDKGEKL